MISDNRYRGYATVPLSGDFRSPLVNRKDQVRLGLAPNVNPPEILQKNKGDSEMVGREAKFLLQVNRHTQGGDDRGWLEFLDDPFSIKAKRFVREVDGPLEVETETGIFVLAGRQAFGDYHLLIAGFYSQSN